MSSPDDSPSAESEATTQRTADRLALALEDAGFDVGRDFPMLHADVDRHGAPVVALGYVAEAVAARLTTVLAQASQRGADTGE